jgi:hypothetical protein
MLIIDATGLPRLMECNGSRLMPPSFPAVDDPTARDEGTAAHYMAQQIFSGAFAVEELIDRKAPNGFYMTHEMSEYVTSYLAALDWCGDMEIDTSWGDGVNFRINGRADHVAFAADIDTLYIDDFKYGFRLVEPERNWTLISHAIGYCANMQIAPRAIILRIHQPRPHHSEGKTRSWMITYAELQAFMTQISATLTNPSDMLMTGVNWCATCHALATCPAARKAGYNAIDATNMAFDDASPDDLLSYELDTLRTAKATLENRLDALEELTKHRLTGGAVVPNYAIEHQYGNRRFKPGFGVPLLFALTGANLMKEGLVTPAEAERRLVALGKSKEQAAAIVASLSEKPMTGTKLIRVSAARRAERIFGNGA